MALTSASDSLLCSWSTFGSSYSLQSSLVWCRKLCIPGSEDILLVSNFVRLSGNCQRSDIFSSLKTCLRVHVRALAAPLRTFTDLSLTHSCIALVVGQGSLTCWKVMVQLIFWNNLFYLWSSVTDHQVYNFIPFSKYVCFCLIAINSVNLKYIH